jgi:phage antirepressor YoqD-like protein
MSAHHTLHPRSGTTPTPDKGIEVAERNSFTLDSKPAPHALALVQFKDERRVDSRVLADSLGVQHKATMSSREIAEVTGKDLSHIHRDTRSMLDELAGSDDPDLDHVREDKDARGYTTCFHLPKGLTITLMTGYSVKMRHAVVKRWQELEAILLGPVVPQSLSAALRLAADQADQIEAQQAQLAIAAPKVAALDRLTQADGSLCLTDAAKSLGMAPRRLTAWMSAEKWIFKRAGGAHWIAYQPRLQSGMLEHKPTTLTRPDGSEKITEQVRVTAKGLAKLAKVAV